MSGKPKDNKDASGGTDSVDAPGDSKSVGSTQLDEQQFGTKFDEMYTRVNEISAQIQKYWNTSGKPSDDSKIVGEGDTDVDTTDVTESPEPTLWERIKPYVLS